MKHEKKLLHSITFNNTGPVGRKRHPRRIVGVDLFGHSAPINRIALYNEHFSKITAHGAEKTAVTHLNNIASGRHTQFSERFLGSLSHELNFLILLVSKG